MLETLADKEKCDIGQVLRETIDKYLMKIQPPPSADGTMATEPEISREDLESYVTFVRVEQMRSDDTMIKLLVCAPTWIMRDTVRRALTAMTGITHLTGVAPAGWMEQEMSCWLEALIDSA